MASISHSTANSSGRPMAAPSSRALGEVGQEQAQGQLVEAEALLDDEGAVEAGRQVDDEADQDDEPRRKREAVQSGRPRPAPRSPRAISLQPAAQRQRQDDGIDDDLDQARRTLRGGVVGGLADGLPASMRPKKAPARRSRWAATWRRWRRSSHRRSAGGQGERGEKAG
jgi:hypothetical protein